MRKFALLAVTWMATSLAACGNYHVTYKKDYSLFFDTDNPRIKKESERLVRAYNQHLGRKALSVAGSSSAANSYVKFTPGLREGSDGKLGFGKWETATHEEPDFRRLEGRTLERVIEYSMQLEFDENFFDERSGMEQNTEEWQRLFLLFSHEVGHGMQMDHSPDKKDVMYYLIDGVDGIKFEKYFKDARVFLDRH